MSKQSTESHPFPPFIPKDAEILFMGTFPPKPDRWSMDFYYPNWINDMWRIMGILFYGNKEQFCDREHKTFYLNELKQFLCDKRIALHDTGAKVVRLKDNAADKFLDIVKPVDLESMISAIPDLKAIATTGEKAAGVIAMITDTEAPKVGESIEINYMGRKFLHYRLPSTSRAYPLSIDKKSQVYGKMFSELGYELFQKNA